MKHIAFTGVTLSGNMGGTAMLFAALNHMRRHMPGCHFDLLSVYPKADRSVNCIPDLRIVSAHPFALICCYLPLSLMVWPVARHRFVRQALARIPYFASLLQSCLVVDLCGISFVDGRGLPLLIYNVACCLPAIVMGVPVAKLAQALGPFNTRLNRFLAGLTLRRCAVVIARGAISAQNLAQLKIAHVTLPDVAFALEVPDEVRQQARAILAQHSILKQPLIVSPSRVVAKLCSKQGIDFFGEMRRFLEMAHELDMPIALLPHSVAKGFSKNNDVSFCRHLFAQLSQAIPLRLIDNIEDPLLLRAIIGEGRIFVGCRFHAIVSALAMEVPCVVIGWSQKYVELLESFGLENMVINFSDVSAEILMERIRQLQQQRSLISEQIRGNIGMVKQQAMRNFELAAKVTSQYDD